MAVSDELLRRGAKELLSDQWQVLRNDASVDISFKRLNGPCLLRLPYKVPMPGNVDLSTLADMPRPEIFCNRKELRAMGVQLEAFDIQQVDKVFSPGDCFVSSRHDSECNDLFAEMKQVGALVGALAAPEPDSAPKPELTERLLTWRNFPVESALTIIAVPFDEEAQMFRYQYRQHFTCICVLIPSRALEAADAQQEDGKNELQVLIGLFTEDVASWATDAIQVLHGAMSQLVQREMYLLEADRKFYRLLSLRTCQGGWPLLPGEVIMGENVELQDSEVLEPLFKTWARPLQSTNFSFADYLHSFMKRIGAEIRVFDSMDGRPLVFYQAVVRTSQWELVAPRFQEAWDYQRLAYSRIVATKRHAPSISDHRNARFVEVDVGPIIHEESPVQVRNTFLHFAEPQDFTPKRRLSH
ncbi:lon2 [Symbiodinium natans]|uniref:Lon2 protein n=1 Tax=Symbiodinium natans TaxID=878477 RepID=A0A812JLJ3_9DINO|nr:lon2 [Symbiodinium natans]